MILSNSAALGPGKPAEFLNRETPRYKLLGCTVTKDDWYFVVSAVLAVLGLLGMDWEVVRGRIMIPKFNKRHWLFLALIAASLLMSGIGWYKSTHRDERRWATEKQETVYGRTFENETVDLDGRKFDHCTFKNVRMRFQGRAPTDFVYCQFQGKVALDTNNIVIVDYERLVMFIKDQAGPANVSTGCRDEHGNINPCP